MLKIIKYIKDIISPKKCYSCKKEGKFLCLQCLSNMSNFNSFCYLCKGKSDNYSIHASCKKDVYYDKLLVLTHYRNTNISKLIKDAKFHGRKDIFDDFGKYLKDLLIENISDLNFKKSDFILIPVPMYFFRKIHRGYNGSEILAKYISYYSKIEVENKLVKRIKNTRQQSKLGKTQRRHNLDKAFKINKNQLDKLDKKVFIIVDDVVSTGTTINEISKLLKSFGVEKIVGLVIASD